MPTIKGIGGAYRLFFYSFDCNERMHVHVQREKMACKFWLDPVVLAKNYGFSKQELRVVSRLVRANLPAIREAWHEHCNPE